MGWPQWSWVALAALSWVVTLAKHGEEKTGKHDIGMATAGLGLGIFLLWQGGFFG